jgi:hypothetical protein
LSVIHKSDLAARHDFEASGEVVQASLARAMRSHRSLLRMLGRYTSWNGFFGSGVATLAGKIGRCRSTFLDPGQPILHLADRSVFVASFFFDAARDEFDDRKAEHRDTHRCLAQALVGGVIGYAELGEAEQINELLAEPSWLHTLQDRVALGYGAQSEDHAPMLFRSMGYHLGSEVLADEEFSRIDDALREADPALVRHLEATEIDIAGKPHNAYRWISAHSGHGSAVEWDHFTWAVEGVELAFQFTPPERRAEFRQQVFLGFDDFARDHAEFFKRVNEP